MMRNALLVGLLGIGLGLFSVTGDFLPIDTPLVVLVAMANAVGPWIVVGFLAGSMARTVMRGAVLGATTLILAVAMYYVAAQVAWGSAFVDPSRAISVWAAVAVLVGGPVGAAGATWAYGSGRRRAAAVGLLAGLLLAEAIARFIEVEGWTGYDLGRTALQVAAVDAIFVALAPLLLLRHDRRTAILLALLIGAVCAGLLLVAIPFIRGAATG